MDLCVWSIIWGMIRLSCRQRVYHTAKAQRNSAKTKHSSATSSATTTRRLSRCAKSNYTYAYRWIAGANGSGTALRMSMNIPPAILLLSTRRKKRNPVNGGHRAQLTGKGATGFSQQSKEHISLRKNRNCRNSHAKCTTSASPPGLRANKHARI